MLKKIQIKSSIGMFDLLKGVAMIMLVFVHTFQLFQVHPISMASENTVLRIFETVLAMVFIGYLMPALLVVSGYGARKSSSNAKNVIRQAKMLLIPYLITAAATCVLHLITHYSLYHYLPGSFTETLRIAGGFLLGLPETTEYFGFKLFSCGPNWFLLTLFWGLIIFNVLLGALNGIKLIMASAVIACIGWGLTFLPFEIPWCFSQGCVACFFICLGYLVKKNRLFMDGISKKGMLLFFCLVIIPNCIPGIRGLHYWMAEGVYPLGPVTIIENGLFAVFIVWLFLIFNVCQGRVFSAVRSLGRVSIYFLCVHTMEMMGFPLYHFVEMWHGNAVIGAIFFSLVRLIADIAICFLVVRLKQAFTELHEKGIRKND